MALFFTPFLGLVEARFGVLAAFLGDADLPRLPAGLFFTDLLSGETNISRGMFGVFTEEKSNALRSSSAEDEDATGVLPKARFRADFFNDMGEGVSAETFGVAALLVGDALFLGLFLADLVGDFLAGVGVFFGVVLTDFGVAAGDFLADLGVFFGDTLADLGVFFGDALADFGVALGDFAADLGVFVADFGVLAAGVLGVGAGFSGDPLVDLAEAGVVFFGATDLADFGVLLMAAVAAFFGAGVFMRFASPSRLTSFPADVFFSAFLNGVFLPFFVTTTAALVLFLMTMLSGERACPVTDADAFELRLGVLDLDRFLSGCVLWVALAASLALARAPGAGVFLAMSAQSFFFVDILGVLLGSATVARGVAFAIDLLGVFLASTAIADFGTVFLLEAGAGRAGAADLGVLFGGETLGVADDEGVAFGVFLGDCLGVAALGVFLGDCFGVAALGDCFGVAALGDCLGVAAFGVFLGDSLGVGALGVFFGDCLNVAALGVFLGDCFGVAAFGVFLGDCFGVAFLAETGMGGVFGVCLGIAATGVLFGVIFFGLRDFFGVIFLGVFFGEAAFAALGDCLGVFFKGVAGLGVGGAGVLGDCLGVAEAFAGDAFGVFLGDGDFACFFGD